MAEPSRSVDVLQSAHRRLLNASVVGWLALVPATGISLCQGQRHPLDPPIASQAETPQHRVRLILKDGSYQSVISYKVVGDRVRYRSAERNGQEEEIPLSLIDLAATKAWEQEHDPTLAGNNGQAKEPPVLSPELAREEAARAARTPEVAKDLRLPEDDSVLVLDTFRGTPELVPLPQSGSDLNRETAHAAAKKDVNPSSSPHDLILLKGETADVQLHVPDPVFYVRIADNGQEEVDSAGFVVDTHGQAGKATPSGGSAQSGYVLEQVDVRQGARAVASFRVALLGTSKTQPGVIEVQEQVLPGGVWKKLTPVQPLEFGEYALIEILNDRTINADVWDFGVHPTAKENDEALRPERKRPAQLERRGRP